MGTGNDCIKCEDYRLWCACGATGCNHDGIASLNEGARSFDLIVNSCNSRGFDRFHHHASRWGRKSLVKGKDCVSLVPSAPNAVDHLRATRHVEADQFVHAFRLWEVRHLTNE